jgi:diguanylate cyclase (GGDEF)-like protein
MTKDPPSTQKQPSRQLGALLAPERLGVRGFTAAYLDGFHGALLVLAGLVLVGLIALLDYETGPYLSCSIFYLIPVAACAWWGGFSHGILVAVAGSVAWHIIDLVENPALPSVAGVWNGIVRFGTLTLVSSLVSRLHSSVQGERRLARTDPLTGAANARTFYETAVIEAERARRATRPLTLAYFDMDNFKQLNDRLGHAAGDKALLHVVQTIRANLRGADLLARLGGDEFALLLPEQGAEGAVALLNRLQVLLSEEMVRKGWPVTLSIGAITFLRPLWDVDQMIQQVDALMYEAKRKGKGRVEHMVVEEGQLAPPDERRLIERRAAARMLCNRTARVRRERQAENAEEFGTVRDISLGGISLYLDQPIAADSLVMVEPLSPGARVLLARVVYAAPDGRGWKHGCELAPRLNAEELGVWLGLGHDCPVR